MLSRPPEIRGQNYDGTPFELSQLKGGPVPPVFRLHLLPRHMPPDNDGAGRGQTGLGQGCPRPRRRLQLVFVTIDPLRDNLARIEPYVKAFHPQFYGVYVPETALDVLKPAYGLFVEPRKAAAWPMTTICSTIPPASSSSTARAIGWALQRRGDRGGADRRPEGLAALSFAVHIAGLPTNQTSMRTFIAIEIPPGVKQVLRSEQQRLRDLLAGARSPAHLALDQHRQSSSDPALSGRNTTQQSRHIRDGLAGLAAAHRPFKLSLSRLGCFRSWKNLRVVWVGIEGDAAALRAVQSDVESLACRMGFDAVNQPFSPHVTLARTKRNAPRSAIRRAAEQLRRAATEETSQLEYHWSVRDLYFIRSVLGGGGPQYSTLARCPLHVDSQ